jgi:hypothetical protein
MRIAPKASLLLAMTLSAPALGEQARSINTCFEESVAALRSSQLEQAISHCDKVIADKATPPERRAQALAQRGLMYGRRWSIVSTPAFAFQAIADISEGLRLHSPAMARRHLLLVVRAQLYAATGQTRRALDDYAAVLEEDSTNSAAREGQKRLGLPEGF